MIMFRMRLMLESCCLLIKCDGGGNTFVKVMTKKKRPTRISLKEVENDHNSISLLAIVGPRGAFLSKS